MNFFECALVGKQIEAVFVDSEVTYILLENGTQITIKGLVIVEPHPTGTGADHPEQSMRVEQE